MFFHRPEELESEGREAGFDVRALVVVQGPGPLAKDLENAWKTQRNGSSYSS